MKADIQKSRAAALLLALCLIAVFSLSALFVVSHADHDCTGADCAICHQINLCENLLNSLGTATAVCAAAAAVVYLLCRMITLGAETDCTFTLVSLKVKLSN